jgi:hypothetical protein
VAVDESGKRVRVARLTGWTRGLAVSDDFLFVGESAQRHDPSGGWLPDARARISILARHDWAIVRSIEVPCRELYDLVLVSASLRDGVRRGFATNPHIWKVLCTRSSRAIRCFSRLLQNEGV